MILKCNQLAMDICRVLGIELEQAKCAFQIQISLLPAEAATIRVSMYVDEARTTEITKVFQNYFWTEVVDNAIVEDAMQEVESE